ncbi:MAG: M28 family peptidase [Trueperaceae bacterium]|nr:M28 family peptidase [Trueperaceae bacterium]
MTYPDPTLVHALCEEGPRPVGSDAHARARSILRSELERIGAMPYDGEAYDLPYDAAGTAFVNLVGEVPGEDPDLPPLVIGAHYDTVPTTPGANDNAASIAVALAVGERASDAPLRRGLVLGLFDAEEPPYYHQPTMGSIRFVEDVLDARGVAAMVALDLIGRDPDVDELVAVLPTPVRLALRVGLAGRLDRAIGVLGAEDDRRWDGPVRAMQRATPGRYRPRRIPHAVAPDMSDHYAFRRAGWPYLFLSSGMGPTYHEPTDVPETLDGARLDATTDALEGLLRSADDAFA